MFENKIVYSHVDDEYKCAKIHFNKSLFNLAIFSLFHLHHLNIVFTHLELGIRNYTQLRFLVAFTAFGVCFFPPSNQDVKVSAKSGMLKSGL